MKIGKSKKGSSSIFIALILAALIFVEGIYLAAIIDANRRITINRALRLQVEQILASYNEQLFLEYGIYGFFEEDINQDIFRRVIEESGYTYGGDIIIEGYKTINTGCLERAISTYYSYRTIGIVFKDLSPFIGYIKEQLDNYGFSNKISSFKQAGGNKVLNLISKGAKNLTDILESDEIQELISISDADLGLISDLFESYELIKDCELEFDKDFSPEDMFSMSIYNDITSLYNNASDVIKDDFFFLCLAHYAVNNFEGVVKEYEEDGEMVPAHNLRGTPFRDLNDEECLDLEYIVSGARGSLGVIYVGTMISVILILSEFVNILLDEELIEIIDEVSEIISDVLAVLLDGVKIPPFVIKLVIIMYMSIALMIKDIVKIYQGKTVKVLKIKKAPSPICDGIALNYKDFAFFYALIGGAAEKSRMLSVLDEKYGPIITKIDLGAEYDSDIYHSKAGYDLYGF